MMKQFFCFFRAFPPNFSRTLAHPLRCRAQNYCKIYEITKIFMKFIKRKKIKTMINYFIISTLSEKRRKYFPQFS